MDGCCLVLHVSFTCQLYGDTVLCEPAFSTYLKKIRVFEMFSDIYGSVYYLCTVLTLGCFSCLTFTFHRSDSNLSDINSILAPTQQSHNQLGGTGIQWCLRMLVEMDGSKKRIMNLHHSPSLFLSCPCTPTVPSCSFVFRLCLCICLFSPFARPYLCFLSNHPSIQSLDTWKEVER